MSTPEGPDRQGRYGSDGEQTGELPTWGTPPPGGWGQADPDPSGRDDDPDGARASAAQDATGGWAPTGGLGSTGVWEQTGGTGATGTWDRTGGAGAPGAWAPAGDPQSTGGWNTAGGTQDTGAWDPAAGAQDTGGWQAPPGGGRRRAEDRVPDQGWDQQPGWDQQQGRRDGPDPGPAGRQPVWGDEATVPAPVGGRRRAPEGPGEPRAAGVWGPADGGGVPGDEPWAPDDVVRRPKRGPGGLSRGVLAAIGGGVLVVAVLLVLAFVAPGFAVDRTLDKTALQNGVTQILTQNYRLQVGSVECQDDVEVEIGTTFECQAVVDGEPVAVPGRVIGEDGAYQVGRV